MRVHHIKHFINQAECDALNAWVDEAAEKKWMDCGRGLNGVWDQKARLTTRVYGERFIYPPLVNDICMRIAHAVDLTKFQRIYNHGRDGVVVSRTDIGGYVFEHTDPLSLTGDLALRCNILTRKPSAGGVLSINDKTFDIEVGELHCYLASLHPHSVSVVKSGPSRVLWMFGAYVPQGFWE